MKLTQLFTGETHTETPGRIQLTPAQAENMNRQISSLVPGQTISGEIISRNGSEVQVKISEDLVLNARVDRNLNLEIGKNMTFEVKNNGRSLTLSPLFTNVSTDVNVLKALEMARLPITQSSVSMTEQLMAAGLSINRNALQQVFREINSFPQGTVSDIVNLHRLQMPVNETNVNQMVSYRNLTHQLTEGMNTVLDALPEVFDSMAESGDTFGAARLYQELLSLVGDNGEGIVSEGTVQGGSAAEGLPAEGTQIGSGSEGLPVENTDGMAAESSAKNPEQLPGMPGAAHQTAGQEETAIRNLLLGELPEAGDGTQNHTEAIAQEPLQNLSETGVPGEVPGKTEKTETQQTPQTSQTLAQAQEQENPVSMETSVKISSVEVSVSKVIPASLRQTVAEEALRLLSNAQLPVQETSELRAQILQFARGQIDAQTLFGAFRTLADVGNSSVKSMQLLEKLFSGSGFRELLTSQLKKRWTVSPREVADPGKVEELYRRLDNQLKHLTRSLENANQINSTAYKAASAMSQNIDFLQQINQMYTYIQLPLRLQQREAHGELYVYSNKKKITRQDGTISALLHLDMEYLGTIDVYVALQNNKVNTKFYLRDDDMIDFLSDHMDLLTQRLKKRGYDCSIAMTVRGQAEESTNGGLEPLLRQEKGVALSQYAFDVRT